MAANTKPGVVTLKHSDEAQTSSRCFCCRGSHPPKECSFRHVQCHSWKQCGHIVKVYWQNTKLSSPAQKTTGDSCPGGRWHSSEGTDVHSIFQVMSEEPSLRVVVQVNGQFLEMQAGSGAICLVTQEGTMERLRLFKRELQPFQLWLCTYSQQELKVSGSNCPSELQGPP